jgi:hypothetical protein
LRTGVPPKWSVGTFANGISIEKVESKSVVPKSYL